MPRHHVTRPVEFWLQFEANFVFAYRCEHFRSIKGNFPVLTAYNFVPFFGSSFSLPEVR
jgi:hypothetical protein